MPQFNAASVVDALDFNFNPHVAVQGTIAEPTDNQIADYLKAYKAFTEDIRSKIPSDIDPDDTAAVMEAMGNLDIDTFISASQKLAGITADLCGGFPSRENILALPPRIRNIFYAWVQEQVMAPEAVTDGGKRPVNGQRR